MRVQLHVHILILMFLGYGEALVLFGTLVTIGEYGQAFTLLGSLFQPLAIGYHE